MSLFFLVIYLFFGYAGSSLLCWVYLVEVRRLLIAVESLVAEQGLSGALASGAVTPRL